MPIGFYESHRDFIHDVLWRVVQTAGKQGATFLAFLIAAKLLTPFDFGIYNYLIAVILLLMVFGDFGISVATSKFVAQFAESDPARLRGVLATASAIVAVCSGVLILAVACAGPFFFGDRYVYVLALTPLLFLMPMTALYDGIYRGLRRFQPLAIIACITGALSIGMVYGLTRGYGLMGALLAQDVFYALLLIALAAGYRGFAGRIDRHLIAELVRYAVLVGVANVGYYLYTRADIIILKHFGYVVEIGYYEIINRLFNVFIVPSVIVAQVLAPRITALASRGDMAEIRRRLARYAGVVLVVFAVGAMISYPIFTYAIKRFLPEYAAPLMFQSLFLLMFLVPAKSWGAFLSQGFAVPAGHAHVLTITTLAGGLLNVVFDVVFIHYLGYIGAIWSTLVIHSATIAITHWYFLRLLRRRIAGGDGHAVA